MNLLDKIKSILNIGNEESRSTNATATTDVSSYESNSSDPSGNGTVDKKSDAETTTRSETGSTGIPDMEEAEADAGASEEHADGDETVTTTGSETEQGGETEPNADTKTVSEAASEDVETASETNKTASETNETASETDEAASEEPVESEPVDVIKGVGTTYAERLGGAGIESVADLAAADPEAIADETDISAKRIERWMGRAEHR